ncbi:unnamed protein product [Phytomonas sp. EM1]|nr:unnamed protein product [Phytomonas sp. EM1]|eukprot:CCW65613.1 unnamed protein product [Phytomonas sp. isolate EM1]
MTSTRSDKKATNDTLPPLSSAPPQSTTTKRYHRCGCYRHDCGLPEYKLLAMPRTNNFYAAVGGCPCIPRTPAHPGSWRLKAAQLRSATHGGGSCICKNPSAASNIRCCFHSGAAYGWKPGPHPVHAKNTAACGKCDTFGNLAFKSKRLARLAGCEEDGSDLSSVSPQKLEDLETLVLEEHGARVLVESDIKKLREMQESGSQKTYMQALADEERRRRLAEATEGQLNELLNDIRGIVERPLNQTNMDILHRIIARQEQAQRNRDYIASQS